ASPCRFACCYLDRQQLHSFPTRRSSDLSGEYIEFIPLTMGYYCLITNYARYCLLVAPAKTYQPPLLNNDNKVSGLNVQLYSLRSDRKSTRLNSSHVSISYAVFCSKKKTN